MPEQIELIRMRREEPAYEGAPTTADVHPLEVPGYLAAGWTQAIEENARLSQPDPEGGPVAPTEPFIVVSGDPELFIPAAEGSLTPSPLSARAPRRRRS